MCGGEVIDMKLVFFFFGILLDIYTSLLISIIPFFSLFLFFFFFFSTGTRRGSGGGAERGAGKIRTLEERERERGMSVKLYHNDYQE